MLTLKKRDHCTELAVHLPLVAKRNFRNKTQKPIRNSTQDGQPAVLSGTSQKKPSVEQISGSGKYQLKRNCRQRFLQRIEQKMTEPEFINQFVSLTDCSESLARSVFMHFDLIRARSNGLQTDSRIAIHQGRIKADHIPLPIKWTLYRPIPCPT